MGCQALVTRSTAAAGPAVVFCHEAEAEPQDIVLQTPVTYDTCWVSQREHCCSCSWWLFQDERLSASRKVSCEVLHVTAQALSVRTQL